MPVESDRDLSHLHRTNAVPSSHDRTILRGLIHHIDQGVSSLGSLISQLEETLSGYKKQRAELIEQRGAYTNILSPLRWLPVEIFGEIFEYASVGDPWFFLCALHVCQLWRQAAQSHSELWSTIRMGHHATEDSARGYIIECVDRARSRPMSLIFNDVRGDFNPLSLLLQLTSSCCWKSVTWIARRNWAGSLTPLVDRLMLTSSDTLENLMVDNDKVDTPVNLTIFDLQRASSLRSLSLAIHQVVNNVTLTVPWAHLTELSLKANALSSMSCLSILRRCTTLRECTLHVNSYAPINKTYETPFELTGLLKLHLHTRQPEGILLPLIAPAIEDLAIEFYDASMYLSETEVMDWVAEHAPKLRKLFLCGVSDEDLDEIIPRLNSLEELAIVGVDEFETDTFSSLVVRPTTTADNICLPKLEIIKIACRPTPHVQKSFVRFARSRWWPEDEGNQATPPCARLCHASLHNINPDERLACVKEVDRLRRLGMDINVLTPTEVTFEGLVGHDEHPFFH